LSLEQVLAELLQGRLQLAPVVALPAFAGSNRYAGGDGIPGSDFIVGNGGVSSGV
jgi:hypothetical protein